MLRAFSLQLKMRVSNISKKREQTTPYMQIIIYIVTISLYNYSHDIFKTDADGSICC